jgi:hypothetical protein
MDLLGIEGELGSTIGFRRHELGEIGTVERFGKEGGLALYLSMSSLYNSSGNYHTSTHVLTLP